MLTLVFYVDMGFGVNMTKLDSLHWIKASNNSSYVSVGTHVILSKVLIYVAVCIYKEN